jgi:hypothetical protein
LSSFQVVTLALCEPSLLDHFIGYYLGQGATLVRIFHDGSTAYRHGAPQVENIECDDRFWAALGMARPASVEDRQRVIYDHAYAGCAEDWCLIVDIDEYAFGSVSLSAYFATVDPACEAVRFGSAEAVFATDAIDRPFGGEVFRKPFPRYLAPIFSRIFYGRYGGVLIRGLMGHARGKEAVRGGMGKVEINIHHAVIEDRLLHEHDATIQDGFWLGHYDAIDFSQWCAKFMRRLEASDVLEMGYKRERQIAFFKACRNMDERKRLFRGLYCLSPWKRALLKLMGYLIADGPKPPDGVKPKPELALNGSGR